MKYVLYAGCLFLLLSCSASEESSATKPAAVEEKVEEKVADKVADTTETARLNAWLDEEFAAYLDFSPLAKTRLGDKSDYDKLDDASDAMRDKRLAWRRTSVANMQKLFDREKLDQQGRLSWDLWAYMLEQSEQGVPFRRHEFIFGRRGPHTNLPNGLINYHKVDNLADFNAYVSRLNQANRYLLQYLERAKLAAAAGIRAPYFDYDIAISQVKRIMKGAPFDDDGVSALWSDINTKLDKLKQSGDVTTEQVSVSTKVARDALLTSVKPAYDEILKWLIADRVNTGETARGASVLPDGEAFYAYRLAQMTTLPLTAEEIHQTGLAEVARIQAEMEGIKTMVEYEGSLPEFFDHMREDKQFYFPNTDTGRSDYLALANDYLGAMKAKLPDYFGILPKAGLEVRRVEAFREQPGAAAHYMRGTKDGSRPGVFYVHLSDMNAMANYRLEDLAYHEGLPGHHMQVSIQQELDNIPRFRTYHGYTAFSEGWGLYAEFLGKEMGFYPDPYSDFGRLSGEIWRAVRLVVDTGIHAMQWSEQQAVDYALQNAPKPEIAVRSEIRRYFNNPAQATAYKIGMLKILELRRKDEDALGDKFDIRAFHDLVLGNGPLPMPLLEASIDRWIAAQ
jgi:uncharacterized protein (DUF885 family)